jgi:hypothetical protein
VIDRIRADAARRGETLAEAVRHHLLAGVIDRVARTGDDFVLRGGMLTRIWIDPAYRSTRDLDFVGDFAFDVEATRARFATALALALPDEIVVDGLTAEGIWLDTAFPGVRLRLAIGLGRADDALAIDVGFGDPLVPEPIRLATGIRAVRPETQLAWKLHALAEMQASFRPKDLADLWLLATHVALDPALVALAIPPAFESRGFTLAAARVLDAPYWATKTSRVRWEPYRERIGELAAVVETVRAMLASPLQEIA